MRDFVQITMGGPTLKTKVHLTYTLVFAKNKGFTLRSSSALEWRSVNPPNTQLFQQLNARVYAIRRELHMVKRLVL